MRTQCVTPWLTRIDVRRARMLWQCVGLAALHASAGTHVTIWRSGVCTTMVCWFVDGNHPSSVSWLRKADPVESVANVVCTITSPLSRMDSEVRMLQYLAGGLCIGALSRRISTLAAHARRWGKRRLKV